MFKVTSTDPNPVEILFFREVLSADGHNVFSSAIGSASASPYHVTVSVDDLDDGQHVVVKALVDNGDDISQTTLCGQVVRVNRPPSAIALSASVIAENSVSGSVVGILSSTDPDDEESVASSSHNYTLVDDSGGLFSIRNGNELSVLGNIDYESVSGADGKVTVRVRASDGELTNCCLEKDFVVRITDVNEAPVASDASLSVKDDLAIGSSVHRVRVTDPDPADTHTFTLAAPSAYFEVSSTTGIVALKAALPISATSHTYILTISVLDSGFPALGTEVRLEISVQKVNIPPTGASFISSVAGCDGVWAHNVTLGTVVGHMKAHDADVNDTHTFALWGCEGWVFSVDSDTGAVTLVEYFNDVPSTDGIQLQLRVTDGDGASAMQDMVIPVCSNIMNPTVSHDAVWCFVDEDRGIGDSVMSVQPGVESFVCKIMASSNDGPVDFEDHPQYTVTVAVTSEGGG
ncbi:kug, partial [Symbiodinium microadriaticum]